MAPAPQATMSLLNDYFGALEAKDYERLRAYYADDITLTFANAATVTGSEAVLALMIDLTGKIRSLEHKLVHAWQEEGGVVVLEILATYRLNDGTSIDIPACSIFTLVDGRLVDMRIYVDHTPVDKALS